MLHQNRLLHLILLVVIFTVVQADDVPSPPSVDESVVPIQPEVTIIRNKTSTIEQYQINGHVYMLKVIPTVGPAYYLIDHDGDGKLETRQDELDQMVVPQWVLFRW